MWLESPDEKLAPYVSLEDEEHWKSKPPNLHHYWPCVSAFCLCLPRLLHRLSAARLFPPKSQGLQEVAAYDAETGVPPRKVARYENIL